MAHRTRRQAPDRAGHRPLSPGLQHRPAGLLARGRRRRPPGHRREQARVRLPGLLGRTAAAASQHAHRFVRQRRPPQRSGDHAPRRAPVAERLRLRADRPPVHDLRHLAVAPLSRHGHGGQLRGAVLRRRADGHRALRVLEQRRAEPRQRDRRPRAARSTTTRCGGCIASGDNSASSTTPISIR